MRARIAALAVGVVFGITLSWSGMSSPDVIRGALLLEHSYLFLFFGSAVATAAAGLWLLRRRDRRALLVDAPIAWIADRPAQCHIVGSLLFCVVWAVGAACPGAIATLV